MTRRSMSVSLWKVAAAAAVAVGLTACGNDNVETAQQALTAVQSSQTTCATLGTAVHACMETMHTCVRSASDAAAMDACKTALASCLPADAPAPPHDGPGGHHGGPGGHHGGPGGHHGGPGGHPGGDMAGGCPGMGGAMPDACDPGAPVVQACASNLTTCLAAGGSAGACVVTADECVAASIQDRFDASCASHMSVACDETSTDPDTCAALDRACKDGVALPDPVKSTPSVQIQIK